MLFVIGKQLDGTYYQIMFMLYDLAIIVSMTTGVHIPNSKRSKNHQYSLISAIRMAHQDKM